MARSRSRAGAAKKKPAARAVRSSSARPAREAEAEAEVEVVEESAGPSWEAGVAVATFLALLMALILLDKHMGTAYGEGFLF